MTANAESNGRTSEYVVLEETSLKQLVSAALSDLRVDAVAELVAALPDGEVYIEVGSVQARNAPHALRQVGRAAYSPGVTPPLAVMTRRSFHPKPITIEAGETRVRV